MNRQRVFDWRFLVSLIALILVSILSWGFVQRVQQADDLIEQGEHTARVLSAAVERIQELENAVDAAAVRAQRDREDRREFRRRIDTLLRYLRSQGLQPPPEAAPLKASDDPTVGRTATRPKAPSRPVEPDPAPAPVRPDRPQAPPPLLDQLLPDAQELLPGAQKLLPGAQDLLPDATRPETTERQTTHREGQ